MCLAIPGQVVELFPDQPNTALIDVVGVRRKVDLGLLQDDLPVQGDWVLIHVGFAMSKISEADAIDQMRTLRALGEAESAMQEVQGYGAENSYGMEKGYGTENAEIPQPSPGISMPGVKKDWI